MPFDTIPYAGYISLQRFDLISSNGRTINIVNQILAVNIYEDLFSPFITGNVVVQDAQDLPSFFPLVGDELLHIHLSTPGLEDSDINSRFFVYKMTDRMQAGERALTYTLHFISESALVDLNFKLSKRFDAPAHDIAQELMNAIIMNNRYTNVQQSDSRVTYISNYWSVVDNMKYLCENSTANGGSPTYLFYENRDGFNFISMDRLAKNDSVQTFVRDNLTTRYYMEGGSTSMNPEADYRKILEINAPMTHDFIVKLKSGAFGSTLLTMDPIGKKYKVLKYTFRDSEEHHLNPFPLITDTLPSYGAELLMRGQNMVNLYSAVQNEYKDYSNIEITQRRISALGRYYQQKIEIDVLGRLDYTIGQKVTVNLPANRPIDSDDITYKDTLLSGNYIISALRHNITRSRHECNMELIRDSIIIDPNLQEEGTE